MANRWEKEEKRKRKKRASLVVSAGPADPRDFSHLRGQLTGISDRSLDIHLALYLRYWEELAALDAEYPVADLIEDDLAPLLAQPVASLKLAPEGDLLDALGQVRQDMLDLGIEFQPYYYLGDGDFWTVDRAIGVNVPWFLANEKLWKLANRNPAYEYSKEDVLRCLRHETGHAVLYAYEIWKRSDWRELFGDFNEPYKENFTAVEGSTDFVEYLEDVPEHYAQKHPDEDWAETFATFLDPATAQLVPTRYPLGTKAREKLEYVGRILHGLGTPTNLRIGKIEPYSKISYGVGGFLGIDRPVVDWSQHADLLRREPFLVNAVRLHELYFDGLGGTGVTPPEGPLLHGVKSAFGSWDSYLLDLRSIARAVDNGWACTVWDPRHQRIRNVLVEDHASGNLADCPVLLALDVWQHAYMPDYGSRREIYLAAVFQNMDWARVEARLVGALPVAPGAFQRSPGYSSIAAVPSVQPLTPEMYSALAAGHAPGHPDDRKYAAREGLVLVERDRAGVPWHYWVKTEDVQKGDQIVSEEAIFSGERVGWGGDKPLYGPQGVQGPAIRAETGDKKLDAKLAKIVEDAKAHIEKLLPPTALKGGTYALTPDEQIEDIVAKMNEPAPPLLPIGPPGPLSYSWDKPSYRPPAERVESFMSSWKAGTTREDMARMAAMARVMLGTETEEDIAGAHHNTLFHGSVETFRQDLRNYYSLTQSLLKADGREKVEVFRGIHGDLAEKIKTNPGFKNGDVIEANTRDLTSWADDFQAAAKFAGKDGVVLRAEVPASMVFAHHDYDSVLSQEDFMHGDKDSHTEHEVIVLNPGHGKMPAQVHRMDLEKSGVGAGKWLAPDEDEELVEPRGFGGDDTNEFGSKGDPND